MLQELALLAANKVAFNEAIHRLQVGISIMGSAVLVGGVSLLLTKRFKVLGLILCMIGAGLIVYPWRAFAPIP